MFRRLKSKKNKSKITKVSPPPANSSTPETETPNSDGSMYAVRLPFLTVNTEMASPTNFKSTRIPSTPATMSSMTPITSSSLKSDYVDLDSSMDSSDGDNDCIPSQIDAEVQAMLLMSPLSKCVFNNQQIIEETNEDGDDDDESVTSATTDNLVEAGTISNSRIGITRPSYSPTYAGSDVTPILNARSLEQYSNPNANNQYRQDQLYQQKIQDGNGTGIGITSPANSFIEQQQLGISSFPITSENFHSDVNLDVQGSAINLNDDESGNYGLGCALDNERFLTPGQAFIKKERSLPRRYSPEIGEGLGITPPPKNRSSRVLVPHVSPPSNDTYTIFILVIQPTEKMFELIRVNYRPATATIGDLVDLIPENVTEENLRDQKYVGLCRPRGSSSASRSLADLDMTASVMARDGTDARILCGEVLVGIPEGFTGKEAQILSQHILKLPKMKKLLQRSDPLSPFKSGKNRSRRSGRSPLSSLGIQPMNKQNNGATEIGTFSSSVLFAPLSAAIDEEVDEEDQKFVRDIQIPRKDMIVPRHTLSNFSAHDDDEYSIGSNLSRRGRAVEYASNLAAKVNLSRKISPSRIDAAPVQTPDRFSTTNTESAPVRRGGGGLTADQIEHIKRDAAIAARIAAEEAYAMRMEELVENLNVSTDEKARIIQEPRDDLSFNSAFSSAFTTAGNAFPSNVAMDEVRSPAMSAMTGTPTPRGNIVNSFAHYDSVDTTPTATVSRKHYSSSEARPQSESPVSVEPDAECERDTAEEISADEMKLIASVMGGFFDSALEAVSDYLETRNVKFSGEVAKRKMALKAMSSVCTLFLSQATNLDDEEEDEDRASSGDVPFNPSDLQQILLIFMMLVQGQNIVTKHKSKRKRRTWRSRVKAIE